MNTIHTEELPAIIEQYLQNRPLFFSYIRPQEALLFRSFSHLITSPSLDYGCGDGFFATTTFGTKTKIDIGLDVYNSRIQEAEQYQMYHRMMVYSGNKIPLPDNSLNTVVSNCVFEHLPNIELAISEIHRVLQPGGICITSVMTDQWNINLLGTKVLGPWYARWMQKRQIHINLFSEEKWRNLFSKQGFSIEDCIGYLSPNNSRLLDFSHYLSLPSLLVKSLVGRWGGIPFAPLRRIMSHHIAQSLEIKTNTKQSSALFFVLKKK